MSQIELSVLVAYAEDLRKSGREIGYQIRGRGAYNDSYNAEDNGERWLIAP